jgi:hypothetical protein
MAAVVSVNAGLNLTPHRRTRSSSWAVVSTATQAASTIVVRTSRGPSLVILPIRCVAPEPPTLVH